MRIVAGTAFSLFATVASAHPGHGSWFHSHQDELIEVAMVAVACLVAAFVIRVMWKVLAK